jgi:hypothetical protein
LGAIKPGGTEGFFRVGEEEEAGERGLVGLEDMSFM